MLNKLKLLYKLSPILLVSITVFSIYFGYNCWQNEKATKQEVSRLEKISKDKEAEIERQYQIALDAQTQKEKVENESLKLQDEFKTALQSSNCASELIPADISNKLRERAGRLR